MKIRTKSTLFSTKTLNKSTSMRSPLTQAIWIKIFLIIKSKQFKKEVSSIKVSCTLPLLTTSLLFSLILTKKSTNTTSSCKMGCMCIIRMGSLQEALMKLTKTIPYSPLLIITLLCTIRTWNRYSYGSFILKIRMYFTLCSTQI